MVTGFTNQVRTIKFSYSYFFNFFNWNEIRNIIFYCFKHSSSIPHMWLRYSVLISKIPLLSIVNLVLFNMDRSSCDYHESLQVYNQPLLTSWLLSIALFWCNHTIVNIFCHKINHFYRESIVFTWWEQD